MINKQSNNQTIKQSNNQTIKQSNNQTIKQPNNQTTKPSSEIIGLLSPHFEEFELDSSNEKDILCIKTDYFLN